MTDPRLAELVEQAFDYRGYVTLRRTDGSALVGFVYDRGPSHVEVFDEAATTRIRVALADIAGIEFSGEDAARKSQDIWERRKGTLEPRDTPASGGWEQTRPVLLVTALDRELRIVARALGASAREGGVRARVAGSDFVGACVGIGGGARSAVERHEPRAVVSFGFAGGLDARLRPGDLVLSTGVHDEGGQRITAAQPLRATAAAALRGLGFFEGEIVCATAVAATPDAKRTLAKDGALAVDMETEPVARAAGEAGLPWLALRAIVDAADSTLPPFAREAGNRGHLTHFVPAALKYAASGPRAVADLIRLARDARRAGAALEEALRRVAPVLAAWGGSA